MEDCVTSEEILKILDKAKEIGVSELEIKDVLSIKFDREAREEINVERSMAEIEKVSEKLTEEDERVMLQEKIEELQLSNPQEIERLITLGKLKEADDGSLILA